MVRDLAKIISREVVKQFSYVDAFSETFASQVLDDPKVPDPN